MTKIGTWQLGWRSAWSAVLAAQFSPAVASGPVPSSWVTKRTVRPDWYGDEPAGED
jgi:hypothetical protein